MGYDYNDTTMITPLESYPHLGTTIGFPGLSLKREDLHPYRSHKGRSIPDMIDRYLARGDRRFAISSSGNAALAAALHIGTKIREHTQRSAEPGITDTDALSLDIFIGNKADKAKLASVKKAADEANAFQTETIRVLVKERPLQALMQATDEGVRSLRQSTDDAALDGYGALAREIAESATDAPIGAIFIGTSSGTTAQALASYFLREKLPIQVHIVQTSSCHPIAEEFDPYDGPEEPSSADAIVDRTAYRKAKLIPLIEQTGGSGWIASNDDILSAQALVREHAGLDISPNSALSIVGAMKAAYTGHVIDGAVVCMIGGR